jgi:hypothetical protein
MHLVMLTLVAPDGSQPEIRPEILVDLLWAHARPGDGIEHLRAAIGPYGIDVSAFAFSMHGHPADHGLREVVQRAIRATPVLFDFHIF